MVPDRTSSRLLNPFPAAIAWADIPSLFVIILKYHDIYIYMTSYDMIMTDLLAPAETRYLAVSTLLNPAASMREVQPPVVTAFTLAPLLTNILQMAV